MSMSRNLAIEAKNFPMLLDRSSFVGYKTAMLRGLAFCGWDGVVIGHLKCPNEKENEGEELERWLWADQWSKWMTHRGINSGLARREGFNELTLYC
jgi:hypothetical protein